MRGMRGVQRQLRRCKGPWIHLLAEVPPEDGEFTWPMKFLPEPSLEFRFVQGRCAPTWAEFMMQFEAAWQFPAFLPYEMSVHEAMSDLSWLAYTQGLGERRPFADVYTFLIPDADLLLRLENPPVFRSLLEDLHEIGKEWAKGADHRPYQRSPIAFHTILHVLPFERDAMWARLQDAKQHHPELEFDEISTAEGGRA